jgi:hypothetical protein
MSGAVTLLAGGAAVAVASRPVARCLHDRLLRWLAGYLCASALVVGTTQLLGLVEALSPGWLLVAALGAAAVSLPFQRGGVAPQPGRVRPAAEHAAVALAGLGLLAWLALTYPPSAIDTLTYHLPNAVRWLQDHTILNLYPTSVSGTYNFTAPSNGELVASWSLGLLGTDGLVNLINVTGWVAGVAAFTALADEVGASRRAAFALAVAFFTAPLVFLNADAQASVDLLTLSWLLAAAVFCTRAWRGAAWQTVLGGVGLGLVAGAKYTLLAPAGVVALVALVALARRHGLRAVAALVVPAVALSVAWYVRNWVVLGNPLFPQELAPLGWAGQPGIFAGIDYTVADYLARPGPVWVELGRDLVRGLGAAWLLAPAGALVAAALTRRTRHFAARSEHRPPASGDAHPRSAAHGGHLLAAGVGFVLLGVYFVTPTSAAGPGPPAEPYLFIFNLRYAFPAFALLAVAASPAADAGWPWSRWLVDATIAFSAYVAATRWFAAPSGWPPGPTALAATAAVVAVGAGCWAAWRWRSSRPSAPPLTSVLTLQDPRARTAVAGVVAVGVVAWAGSAPPSEDRYPALQAVQARGEAYAWARQAAPGTRIGVTGLQAVYPMFGDCLCNRISQLGYWTDDNRFVGITEPARLRRAIDRRDLDAIVVGGSQAGTATAAGRYVRRSERFPRVAGGPGRVQVYAVPEPLS